MSENIPNNIVLQNTTQNSAVSQTAPRRSISQILSQSTTPNSAPKILIIGGGYAGLRVAITLQEKLKIATQTATQLTTLTQPAATQPASVKTAPVSTAATPQTTQPTTAKTTPPNDQAPQTTPAPTPAPHQQNDDSAKPQITLISKHDYHYQTTLLHKVAVGTLSARKARIYYRKLLDLKKVNFIKDKIQSIDPQSRTVTGNGGTYAYDILVVALGFRPDHLGVSGVKENAFKLSSLNAAVRLSKHIENLFKNYAHTKDPLDLSVAVCGTGFTSIEFAAELGSQLGELCEICGIDRTIPRVVCIGRSPKLLPMLGDKLGRIALKKLNALGVELITGASVKEVLKDGVIIQKEGADEKIPAHTILWGAGVKGSDIVIRSTLPNKNGRIEVDGDLRALAWDNIFAVGDSALPTTDGAKAAPTAQLSTQMGDFVGALLASELNAYFGGRQSPQNASFSYTHRGTVCALGHTDGVGLVYGAPLTGELAALMKNTIENRWLFHLGGLGLVYKKGQFRWRTSN